MGSFEQRLLLDRNPWFQKKEFIEVGKCYNTVIVQTEGRWPNERGIVPPNTEVYAGKFVSATSYGYGDNANVTHVFTKPNENGIEVENIIYLDYNGGTRFREVPCPLFERREPAIHTYEMANNTELNDPNNHIARYLGNDSVIKDVASFMGGKKRKTRKNKKRMRKSRKNKRYKK